MPSDEQRRKWEKGLKEDGPERVQEKLNAGAYRGEHKQLAEAFVRAHKEQLSNEQRNEELGYAKAGVDEQRKSNRIARGAWKISVFATVLAVLSLIVSVGQVYVDCHNSTTYLRHTKNQKK